LEKSRILIVAGIGIALAALAVLWLADRSADREAEVIDGARLLAEGIAAFEDREYEDAIAIMQQVPAGHVQEARARYYEGSAHMMLGDYPAAVERLEFAGTLAPADPGIRYALGVAHYKMGNVKLAKGYFASVLEINPMDEKERELQEQARGLMDMMAKYERQSAASETKD